MSLPESASAALAVQGAVRTRLLADSVLTGLITGVVDWVDGDKPFPYIHLGEAVETPDNTHDSHGSETLLTLHVWSKYRGFKEALTIASRVRALLEHQPLTVTGHDHVATYFVSLVALTDPEPPGDIRHVPVSFRVLTKVST